MALLDALATRYGTTPDIVAEWPAQRMAFNVAAFRAGVKAQAERAQEYGAIPAILV